MNRRKTRGNSRFKGVCWVKRENKWQVQIRKDGKQKHIGYFTDEIEAAEAYDEAAIRLFGEYARTNILYKVYWPA